MVRQKWRRKRHTVIFLLQHSLSSREIRPGWKLCSAHMIDWQYLSLGDLEQNEIFSKIKSWGLFMPERLIMVIWHATWPKLANWWRIYFVWINNLAFLIENVPNFLRFEWIYSKFKSKVLNNSRFKSGIKNYVFPHNFLFEVQWTVIPNVKWSRDVLLSY